MWAGDLLTPATPTPFPSLSPAAGCPGLVVAAAGWCGDPGQAGGGGQGTGVSGSLLRASGECPLHMFSTDGPAVCTQGLSAEARQRTHTGSEVPCMTRRLSHILLSVHLCGRFKTCHSQGIL